MKITVLKKSKSQGIRKFNFSEFQVITILFLLIALPFVTGLWGYKMANKPVETPLSTEAIASMQQQLTEQDNRLNEAKSKAQIQLDALTSKMGILQAELTRINALGQRVATLAKVNKNEFDFSQPPGIGGPSEPLVNAEGSLETHQNNYAVIDIFQGFDDFSAQLNDRAYQLEVLESVLLNKKISAERRISGRPINKGWASSFYGTRNDPFNGKPTWHGGIDFAGKKGSDVITTGTGVVTHASKRSNYGLMVEINHGEGLITRYAHNSELLVAIGDVVSKGQVIAKMGSQGRSTGPHVHYEIHKNGKSLNPERYVNRR